MQVTKTQLFRWLADPTPGPRHPSASLSLDDSGTANAQAGLSYFRVDKPRQKTGVRMVASALLEACCVLEIQRAKTLLELFKGHGSQRFIRL